MPEVSGWHLQLQLRGGSKHNLELPEGHGVALGQGVTVLVVVGVGVHVRVRVCVRGGVGVRVFVGVREGVRGGVPVAGVSVGVGVAVPVFVRMLVGGGVGRGTVQPHWALRTASISSLIVTRPLLSASHCGQIGALARPRAIATHEINSVIAIFPSLLQSPTDC